MELARIELDGGGSILVEAAAGAEGPVKAGRISAAIAELPVSLSAALEPVVEASRTVLDQMRKAVPSSVEVEFGVDLAVQAGVVITKTAANCHLKVKVTWDGKHDEPGRD
ncbi:hypothetical protein ABH935_009233 [Catenulispora sp. GAS73]|uniref:CU044_2847 family protein n=1 Tax=Catenulispora sp. GAS73 TaxID=3156269 RepID=UPI003513DAB6